jgi:hypothetical protein
MTGDYREGCPFWGTFLSPLHGVLLNKSMLDNRLKCPNHHVSWINQEVGMWLHCWLTSFSVLPSPDAGRWYGHNWAKFSPIISSRPSWGHMWSIPMFFWPKNTLPKGKDFRKEPFLSPPPQKPLAGVLYSALPTPTSAIHQLHIRMGLGMLWEVLIPWSYPEILMEMVQGGAQGKIPWMILVCSWFWEPLCCVLGLCPLSWGEVCETGLA